MYFHAGQDFVLNTRDVIGVFDLDTAGASRRTEEYFRHAEAEGAVVDLCAPGTLPKSLWSPISRMKRSTSANYPPPH